MKNAIISLILLLTLADAAAAAARDDVRSDAPDRYTVQAGDTLWGIAGRFLNDPWKWPRLWRMNEAQVRNPHRIYPGDVLVLERSSGGDEARLRVETVRVTPSVRVEPRDSEAIHTIAPSVIEPFLSKPLVVGRDELNGAPQITATQEDRVVLGVGNIAYVQGLSKDDEHTRWQIFRRTDPLLDPETSELLGYIAVYLGEARLMSRGPISRVEITRAAQEIVRGDRLVPISQEKPVFAYVPHAPKERVNARIVSTYGGLHETGPLSIVTVSRGSRDGLEAGHVLALYRDQRSARYAARTEPVWGRTGPTGNDGRLPYYPAPLDARNSRVLANAEPVREGDFAQLPAERYGLVMLFRIFERASYGLVMQASQPVAVSDIVTNP